jgi:MFS family permease
MTDRNNLSAGKTRGLEADLKLKGSEYPTCLSILYVGYILCVRTRPLPPCHVAAAANRGRSYRRFPSSRMQIPSNFLIQKLGRPSIQMSVCMALWGAISCLAGITTNFAGMLLCRFFLGFVEAAFFPGALFLLSRWYTRKELGVRTTILYCGSLISNAFGPLIAAGVLDGMEGTLGHRAWRWLLCVVLASSLSLSQDPPLTPSAPDTDSYIEGAVTVLVAVFALFILPDFPHNSRGFSDEERLIAQQRMQEDAGNETDETSFKDALVLCAKDPSIHLMALTLTAM